MKHNDFIGFGSVSEADILLHELFGEGEHPWPPDMRISMTEEEYYERVEHILKLQPSDVPNVYRTVNGEFMRVPPVADITPEQIAETFEKLRVRVETFG